MPKRGDDPLLLELPPGPGRPRIRLEHELRSAIGSGRLSPGLRLPSSRSLAEQLGVSRGVVVEAYAQLEAEGYLSARHGSGTEVATDVRWNGDASSAATSTAEPRIRYDFHAGLPDLDQFPRAAWLRATRRALSTMAVEDLGYADPAGVPSLRHALAGHLARSRGVVAGADSLIVTEGFIEAFTLVCRTLRARGARRLAMEDPGWPLHRLLASHCGLEAVGVPVDEEGMQVARLAALDVDGVVLTPAHQFPTGVVLSGRRRTALLDLCRASEITVVEDDYDAEYRYDSRPVGTLQGLAPDVVVSIGSASKILAPGLRLGWIVTPDRLRRRLVGEKALTDAGSPVVGQWTMAAFTESGDLGRHLRRMRTHYRQRRDCLVDAVARSLPSATVSGVAAGLRALVLLPDGVDDRALALAAGEAGIRLESLSSCRFDGGLGGASPGVLLGFGRMAEPRLRAGVRALAKLVDPALR